MESQTETKGTTLNYLNATIAAKMLGISKPTLLKEANDGHINAHIRRGRYLFTKEDIDKYIIDHMTCRKAATMAFLTKPTHLTLTKPAGANL